MAQKKKISFFLQMCLRVLKGIQSQLKCLDLLKSLYPTIQPYIFVYVSNRKQYAEVDSLNGTVGRKPQVKLRSRARHWSGCTPRPIEFEHRALDLRLTWGFLPHSPSNKPCSLRANLQYSIKYTLFTLSICVLYFIHQILLRLCWCL